MTRPIQLRKRYREILIVTAVLILLSACQAVSALAPAPTHTATAVPTASPAPSPTATLLPGRTMGHVQPVGVPGPWPEPIFDDEFNSLSINDKLWNVNWYGDSPTAITRPVTRPPEKSCYDPSLVLPGDGALTIRAMARPGCQTWDNFADYPLNYASGIIHTRDKFSFTYGVMETRMFTPGSTDGHIANWPAFFADDENWPDDGEIDVVEGLDGEACYHYHYLDTATNDEGAQGGCVSSEMHPLAVGPGGLGDQWHTYAVDWEPGSMTWYYDGVQVWRYTDNVPTAKLFLHLFYGVPESDFTTVPTALRVDYVRVWQH